MKDKRKPKNPINPPIDDEVDDENDDEFELFKEFLEFKKFRSKKSKVSVRGDEGNFIIDNEIYSNRYVNKVMKEWQKCGIIA